MRIRFDYPEYAGLDSEFEIDVEVVPRLGESLLLPASLLPRGTNYCGQHLEFEDWHDSDKTPFLSVKVVEVIHRFSSEGRQTIEVWIEQLDEH